jgi:predicted nucleic acid-binding protein
MTVTAIYDACVLYPNTLRDLLIRLGQAGLVRAKWTGLILDEMLAALGRERPDIPPEKLTVLRDRMNAAVRDCLVTGFETLVDSLDLPDKDDRHVLAAAIRCGAEAIVTFNCRDFPSPTIARWNVEAIDPDDFILDLIDLDAKVVWACLQQIADSRTRPPEGIEDILSQLERSGLIEAVAALRMQ